MDEEADKLGELLFITDRRKKKESDEMTDSTSDSLGATASTAITSPERLNEDADNVVEPGVLEKKLYYFGLPTNPLLVCRTGSTKWTPPSSLHNDLPPKAMRNVGSSHQLVGIWEFVVDDIMKALEPLDWTSIDVLRVGYQGTTETDWPVTLMVGVQPGSENWDVASPVALACRAILRARGVWDVECEIRQSDTFSCVSHRLTTANEIMGGQKELLVFSEYVAQPISPCSAPSQQGTLGIYLTVGDQGVVCALTCRHVGLGNLETDSALETAITDYGYHRGVSQPGQQSPGTFLKTISTQQKIVDRRIGHVLFSPAFTVDDAGQLHDWLLVKLDAARYASLSALQNWICVYRQGYLDMLHLPGKTKPEKKAADYIVRLKGVVSKAEIFRTTANDEPTNNHAALWVHMWTTRSGKLATGISNEVRSVRRVKPVCDSNAVIITREWCVVGRNGLLGAVVHGIDSEQSRLLPFSMTGDSGAAVFDSQGRIADILTSGCGRMEGKEVGNDFGYADVSYVTPIEVILDVLKAKYGHAEIL